MRQRLFGGLRRQVPHLLKQLFWRSALWDLKTSRHRQGLLGEALLHLVTLDSRGGEHNVHSTVQVADVTRALWSVGLICDSGLKVEFGQTMAVIKDAQGVEICVFRRVNGLYVAKAKLRNPLFKGFQRPGE